jgi:hypothetical protein
MAGPRAHGINATAGIVVWRAGALNDAGNVPRLAVVLVQGHGRIVGER